MQKFTQCRECGSNLLKWHCSQKNLSGVQGGLLRMHDVGTEFYLGCDVCSETLQVVSGDQVEEFLNNAAAEVVKAEIKQLELLLANHQTTYGSSERPFKVVESDDIKARIEALKIKLKT